METEMIPVWDLENSQLEYLDVVGVDVEVLSYIQEPISLGGCGFDLLVSVEGKCKLMINVDYDDLCGEI
tara:strand:- start:272 stop:478 length:207 start_codon:yes stop_codon:yes gene_type:complete